MAAWHLEILGTRQQMALAQLGPALRLRGGYLVGGTALALQLGHRVSVDLDFVMPAPFQQPRELIGELVDEGIALRVREASPRAIHGTVRRIKVSLLPYRYPTLKHCRRFRDMNCDVAALDDLAAMKIGAVVQRGLKRDFVDVWALLQSGWTVSKLIRAYQTQYDVHGTAHVLIALTYFDDTNKHHMPRMLWPVRWAQVRRDIELAVQKFSNK